MAAWLGWQIESNWTDPFLFAVYSIIKPIAGAAILVVMYGVITRGDFASPLFAYIFLGNAFYIYVGSVMTGISWAVIEDREHYQTIKYIYIAPVHFPTYLIGRGAARFLTGSMSVVITLVAGVLFLNLQLDPRAINWPMFFAALAAGLAMLAAMGLLLGGITMQIANVIYFVWDAVAGALYLFRAIFPLEQKARLAAAGGIRHAAVLLAGTARRSMLASWPADFTCALVSDAQLSWLADRRICADRGCFPPVRERRPASKPDRQSHNY
jgi:ABC-2 type transport system permease protein